MFHQFSALDGVVLLIYLLLLVSSGWLINRHQASNQSYFLGDHAMPLGLVAISVLATSQSAATFLGGPDQGYRSDLTYLSTTLSALIAALIVSRYLLPQFYLHNVYTVYELLDKRFGSGARKYAGLMYLQGRVFASGARLYIAALAVSMILFADIAPTNILFSIGLIVMCGLMYTVLGGIRSVIFSDTLQAAVYTTSAIAVIVVLYNKLSLPINEIVDLLAQPTDEGSSKLQLINPSFSLSAAEVFSLPNILLGMVLLNVAAFGLDQDMTQRLLTCRDSKASQQALFLSVLVTAGVMFLFITIGLLLYLYYQHVSPQSAANSPYYLGQTVTIFMYFVLTDLPPGIKGLVTTGIIAAALSSLNSGLNSMASVIVQDFYAPIKQKKGITPTPRHLVKAGRLSMTCVAIALGGMAFLCFYWQQYSDTPLLEFALSVMIFSYSGLLGVYFVSLFTKRGNNCSVGLALLVGFITPLLMQPYIVAFYPRSWQFDLAFTWQLIIGTVTATIVCWLGKPTFNETVRAEVYDKQT
ncbi:sodium:solute symporter [Alteromonas sp. ASW11-130]|uniref:sodium:solute symporter n=1 Tax=Alteromonas sp. ASW11-130 TaxID=3015775 RepID=UPI0022423102|nr:sodium:solute symporter [Alteromonas sp. ASW11-130]MCW8090841.1 sodium:solute symporter [Alteromonas sp. ASW11-130]